MDFTDIFISLICQRELLLDFSLTDDLAEIDGDSWSIICNSYRNSIFIVCI